MQNFFRAVEETGFPMTIHVAHRTGDCYGIVDKPGLAKTLCRFPRLRILAHSQVFWSAMTTLETVFTRTFYPAGKILQEGVVPKLLRRHSNLYGDLSAGSGANALARDPEYAVKFLTEFQNRLCFGIDICSASTSARHQASRFHERPAGRRKHQLDHLRQGDVPERLRVAGDLGHFTKLQ